LKTPSNLTNNQENKTELPEFISETAKFYKEQDQYYKEIPAAISVTADEYAEKCY